MVTYTLSQCYISVCIYILKSTTNSPMDYKHNLMLFTTPVFHVLNTTFRTPQTHNSHLILITILSDHNPLSALRRAVSRLTLGAGKDSASTQVLLLPKRKGRPYAGIDDRRKLLIKQDEELGGISKDGQNKIKDLISAV